MNIHQSPAYNIGYANRSTLRYFLVFLFQMLLFLPTAYSQVHTVDNFCITPEEDRLMKMINTFRKQNKLPEIQVSASLCFVAKTHASDLQLNRPDTSVCNTGSWSNKGNWKSCCYNPYVYKPECMWDKPKELTQYTYRGYELSYFEESIVQADSIFKLWVNATAVVDFILGKGDHSDKKWAAMGVGLSDNYVSLWFGQRIDAKGKPKVCDKNDIAFRAAFTDSQAAVDKAVKGNRFYLIYGSFSTVADAQEAVRRYKNSGFKSAQVLNRDNKIRVALDVYDSLKEAMAAKEKLSASYSDAWILKD